MNFEEPNSERKSSETTVLGAEEANGEAEEEEEEEEASVNDCADIAEKGDTSLQSNHRSNNRRSQFRPRPGGKAGATSYQLRQYAEATLGGGSLRKIVKLPEGEDENEWFAVNSTSLLPGPRHRDFF